MSALFVRRACLIAGVFTATTFGATSPATAVDTRVSAEERRAGARTTAAAKRARNVAAARERRARRRAAANRRLLATAAAKKPATTTTTTTTTTTAPTTTTTTTTAPTVVDPTQWLGGFETGNLSQWNVQAAASDRVTLHTDTPREGRYYARLRTEQGDLGEQSRSQLNSPYVIPVGSERYMSWSTRFPASFPVVGSGQRVMFMQAYGAPYTYSPLVSMRVVGDKMRLTASKSLTSVNTYDGPIWESPVVRGEWQDFTLRMHAATDLSGWVELWHQGVRQRLMNGSYRYPMQTIEVAQTEGLKFILNNYRGGGFTTTVIEHDGARVAATAPAGLTF